jgi:uncharacterized protein
MRRIAFVVFLFLMTVVPATVFGVSYPARPDGYVTDLADLLTDEQEGQLEQMLTAHTASTTNEIAVLTISSLEGTPIERASHDVFNEWGIGQADKDNGVLLLVARDDREVRIEVGYGLEGALTDLESKAIISQAIVPEFRADDYGAGIIAGVDGITTAIAGEYQATTSSSESSGAPIDFILFMIFFGISLFFSFLRWLAHSKSIWPGAAVFGGLAAVLLLISGVEIISLLIGSGIAAVFGGILDAVVSHIPGANKWAKKINSGKSGGFWTGGGSGRSGGGFGGFSGGSSGGGGASGSW